MLLLQMFLPPKTLVVYLDWLLMILAVVMSLRLLLHHLLAVTPLVKNAVMIIITGDVDLPWHLAALNTVF